MYKLQTCYKILTLCNSQGADSTIIGVDMLLSGGRPHHARRDECAGETKQGSTETYPGTGHFETGENSLGVYCLGETFYLYNMTECCIVG